MENSHVVSNSEDSHPEARAAISKACCIESKGVRIGAQSYHGVNKPVHGGGQDLAYGPSLRPSDDLMEPFGALPTAVMGANSLENMVGPNGLEPLTSTVSR